MVLLDREAERAELDAVLDAVREHLSRVLVVVGEAGIGKTVLLDHFVESARDIPLVRTCAIQSEMELSYAGLHQLLVPFLDGIDTLPGPQRTALSAAFGFTESDEPNPFLVGLAVLTLLADAAAPTGLLCVIDDAQWLDRESAHALAFVARRLHADAIGMVFGVRATEQGAKFEGLPELRLAGLPLDTARELLSATAGVPVDGGVAQQLVTQTEGNPLVLVELAGVLSPEELSGSVALAEPLPISPRLEEHFLRQVRSLPAETQTLLAIAAADASGDVEVAWQAAEHLGLSRDAIAPAERDGLLVAGSPFAFRHPLIRSAVYYGASAADRRRIHGALALASASDADPRRRVWHEAAAADGYDERVAAELEAIADAARRRGGPATAAAYLARAAQLSPDRRTRARRLLATAHADVVAGAPMRARARLDEAIPSLDDPLGRAEADRLRGAIRVALGDVASAPELFLTAARAFARHDPRAARESLLDALSATLFTGAAAADASAVDVAEAARVLALPADSVPTAGDRLLDGFAMLFTEGHAAAAPLLRSAVALLADHDESPTAEHLRWLGFGCWAAGALADHELLQALASRLERQARESGALVALTRALYFLAMAEITAGALDAADAHFAESREMMAARGDTGGLGPLVALAWQGRAVETKTAAVAALDEAQRRGQGGVAVYADYAIGVLELGLGHYADALVAERRVFAADSYFLCPIALPDLVEAGVRGGDVALARAAVERLAERATNSDTPLARGLAARARALVADDDHAEHHYAESVAVLADAGAVGHLARSQLLYGEWLRREKRRAEAREQLRSAVTLFDEIGAEAFASRARTELRATGERARRRTDDTRGDLTPQESQIARLAASGATNHEIAAQLFLSPSTVDYHLRKVFRKLGITSRRELR
ncbi:MAG TPA: AAA family ATPase [Acidimicrobiia bacterium]|nr:AAA family ATPase [Acidimicrobiia bacterium]